VGVTWLDDISEEWKRQVEARFWSRVERAGPGECWPWQACLTSTGYGTFSARQKQIYAHRFAYEAVKGPIPAGLVIDHLCFNRPCVNPEHLEAVTLAENNRRGDGFAAKNLAKTHCPRAHPYDEANTLVTPSGRQCRTCENARHRTDEFRARRRMRRGAKA